MPKPAHFRFRFFCKPEVENTDEYTNYPVVAYARTYGSLRDAPLRCVMPGTTRLLHGMQALAQHSTGNGRTHWMLTMLRSMVPLEKAPDFRGTGQVSVLGDLADEICVPRPRWPSQWRMALCMDSVRPKPVLRHRRRRLRHVAQ